MSIIFLDDLDVCNVVCNLLEVFYTATNDCSGIYYFTTQLVITHIYHADSTFKEYRKNSTFKDVCVIMKIKFIKYWKKFALIAVIDPRIILFGV